MSEAKEILSKHRIEKLPIIDDDQVYVKGLISKSKISPTLENYPSCF